jgi:hypothetical protein
MGGLACWARFSALVPYDSVPVDAPNIVKFDEGMRKFWGLAPGTVEALIERLSLQSVPVALSDTMKTLCATLNKQVWTHDNRQFLFDTASSLYE